ncbi:MAG: PAS domain-containing protein [Rhodobacteraceae bacterium]|nr:PAS domain-containing protein [Paracoccaceae bacterium]
MSHIERRDLLRPASGEAPFNLDEVFFSRTDERGVILAGNFVLRRVANYEWSEMLGAPHKIIRHPDMPKGVFWLLWDTIKRGKPIGAYVKNRAKDGLYYWVYATVIPCEGGYISARIKPTSATRDVVEKAYADLRQRETDENLTPEQSSGILLDQVRSLGFPDYSRFAAFTLSEELFARDRKLGRPEDKRLTRFRRMLDLADGLKTETASLIYDFDFSGIIPHNMRVIASRLEPNGGPISTLSTNYGAMSREMSTWFENNVTGENSDFTTIEHSIIDSIFLESTVRILTECSTQLHSERRKLGEVKLEVERDHLNKLAEDYRMKSIGGQTRVGKEAKRIGDSCKTMERFMLGLSTTRVSCKIEGARLKKDRESLSEVITQLNGFQQRIRENLRRIDDKSSDIRMLAS